MRLEPGRWWLRGERMELAQGRVRVRTGSGRSVVVRGVHRDGGLYMPDRVAWEAALLPYKATVEEDQ
jgi:hypothetical protein